MPFAFRLSTTSHVAFQDSVSSESHPSLPAAATTARAVVRSTLKRHKRLPTPSQAAHLPDILAALLAYIPHLSAIEARFAGRSTTEEVIQLSSTGGFEVEWRPYLTSSVPGREPPRVKVQGFDCEILFTLLTLGETYYLLGRAQLLNLYDALTPTTEQRTAAIAGAMKHFLDAHGVFAFAHMRATNLQRQINIVDISASTLGALAAVSLAEATLIAVLKDDPYPGAVAQDRNKNDKDWMIMAPSIPKVRAHLFARLCLAAGDHAGRARAMLGSSNKAGDSLVRYCEDLRRTCRGKACRFFGIDGELAGVTGEAIAWLNGARKELGFSGGGKGDETGGRGLLRLKKDWAEWREDRKVEKGADWGSDAGRFEEGRVVDMLLNKWNKMNDTVHTSTTDSRASSLLIKPSGECAGCSIIGTTARQHAIWPRISQSKAVVATSSRCPHAFTDVGPSRSCS